MGEITNFQNRSLSLFFTKIGLKLKPRTRTRSVLSEETENERMLTVKVMAVSQLFCSKNYGTDGKQINAVDLERYSS